MDGDGEHFALETKLILGNFGRLVELTGLGPTSDPSAMPEEKKETSVRRALITDVTARYALPLGLPNWDVYLLANTGFIFDAGGGDANSEATDDAVSYWFFGVSWSGRFGPNKAMVADVLLGKSELLTGVEPFIDGGQWRIRPRLRFRLPVGPEGVDIGFWADLGLKKDNADAVTVFAAVPIAF